MYEIVFEPSDLNMLAAIGIIEKAKLFPYLLSMGDLRHPCDSCYRCEQFIKCLSEYCTDCKSQAKKLWEKYHTTEDIIQDAMMNQKSLRIWVRNTSECWCGIYYICFCAAKRHSANISLASTEDLKKVLEFKGDQISEKTLSSEDIAEYAQKWEKLLRENKPLRIWRTNEVRSVESDYFDQTIICSASTVPISIGELTASTLKAISVPLSDWFIMKRIEELLKRKVFQLSFSAKGCQLLCTPQPFNCGFILMVKVQPAWKESACRWKSVHPVGCVDHQDRQSRFCCFRWRVWRPDSDCCCNSGADKPFGAAAEGQGSSSSHPMPFYGCRHLGYGCPC